MPLAEFYLPLKTAHVGLVLASGSLFAARGAARLAGQAWPMARRWRLVSVAIDSLLLAAGATLWALLALQPLRDAWLGSKLLLLVVYIGLGTLALKRRQAWAYAAALLVLLGMASIARAHHPLGLFA
ncbi:MAG: SirB2 family protein [Rubrivivax sp.]